MARLIHASGRFRHAIRILGIALLLHPGLIQAGVEERGAVPDRAEPLRTAPAGQVLGAGDKVTVTVFGFPDLSGEQILDDRGEIALYMGGPILAAGLTPAALERRITDVLADGYILRPRVSVRISEARPIYVLGDIRHAGPVPFRHGMTVLAAVAMAGGPALAPEAMAWRAEMVEAEERLTLLREQYATLRARAARLTAQRDTLETLTFPGDLENGDPSTARLLASERAVFESERDTEARQIRQLLQQHANALLEVASIAEQSRLARDQLQTILAYLGDMTRLAQEGLIDRRRVIETRQETARLESGLARLKTEAVRAEQIARDVPLRIAEIRATTHHRALTGFQETSERLEELRTRLQATRELVLVRRQRLEVAGFVSAPEGPRLLVTRHEPEGPRTFEVDDATPLLPGDILRVSAGPAAPGQARFATDLDRR